MWPAPHEALPIDPREVHFLYWDPEVYRRLNDFFLNHIDRRGTGRRGPGPWLMAIVAHAARHRINPAGHHHIELDIDEGRHRHTWNADAYRAVKAYWSADLRHDHRHRHGHSLWVNLVAFEAVAYAESIAPRQLTLDRVPAAAPRPQRVAHTATGQSDRRYPT